AMVGTATRKVETVTASAEAQAEPAPAPAPEAEPVAEVVEPALESLAKPDNLLAAPPAVIDDLKRIRGVGPKLEKELNALGIYTFEQISQFSEPNLAWLSANLTSFRDRPLRDNWVEQAANLMAD
ncbi:MAG TPA: hypothetical protein VFR34_13085, partial [Paracoccaceae bacterium]|nr:hypothetical protein [Paracoccaceae bacterium]